MKTALQPWTAFFCSLLVSAAAVGSGSPPANSADLADLSLEELMNLSVEKVYSASKYEQKVTQAPAAVTIITADEISRFGYRTLADVLRSVRGLYVTYDRNYSNIGTRGFARPGDFNTRVLLLVDGHRMNDNLYSSALIGTEAIVDVDLIERVEVIRGPSSSIYGNSAFFGVINVVTRKAGLVNGLEASVAGGTSDSYAGRFTYGRKFEHDLGVLLSGSIFDTQGQRSLYYPEFDTPQTNGGFANHSDGEYSHNLSGSLSYRDLTFSAAYSLRDKDVPTASYGTVFNDGREKTTDERAFLDMMYAHAFGATQLMGRVYYDRYAYRANYPYNFAAAGDPPFIVLAHDDNYGDSVGAELQLTRKILARHTLVAGGEFRRDLNLYQSAFTNDPKSYSFRDNRNGRSYGLYAQGEFVIRENLRVNAGLRLDDYSTFGRTFSPRLGVIYSPREQTTLKLLYGEAYRAPNAYELFQAASGFSKANPDLVPERIRTYELIGEQYLAGNLRLVASAYRYEIEDLISQTFDPADGLLVFRNLSAVEAQGLEVELEGRYSNGLLARLSYAMQKAEDRRTAEELNNSPRHLSKLNISLPLRKESVYVGLELQHSSGLRTLAGDRTGGFFVANATLFSRKLMENLEVSASVYNLFDRGYAYPGSTGHFQDVIPQDGRSLRLKATYHFSASGR